ncbi:glycoside hydrolase family 2 TIM barrel-domain containing protein [Chitinophaga sp.]|uniref:glycoside hydrolase family 2 TIM barrel-domain containing protein n=1 Tax=Chitinophaga sp. TaxID=1869181 RepID=UPI002614F9B9|nr:glycoside hydrolase family 2 TIM barrel-domain containing protein [uncultured Chitinophaga sp.]
MSIHPQTNLTPVRALFISLGLLCAGITACRQSPAPPVGRKVYIGESGGRYTIFRDGQPFVVKGAAGNGQLAALKAAGGNTIRTWDTAGLGTLLDEAEAAGIAVISGLAIPISSHLDFYRDTAAVSAMYLAYEQVVERYKHHPALLMWCLGNEVDFPYSPRFRPFYKVYNRLLDMIHTRDPNHPVTTAIINFSRRNIYNLRWKVPQLDLISMNIFGELKNLRGNLEKFAWFWDGPFLISEWGINGPWESETTAWGAPIENTSNKKAEHYLQRYTDYIPVNNPRFLGACVFFWGQKQEVTHTWFSMFTGEGEVSEAVQTMRYIWTGQQSAHAAPELQYMLLDDKGARDNILLSPGTDHTAVLLLERPGIGALRLKWEVLPEDWFIRYYGYVNPLKPPAPDSLLLSQEGAGVRFRAPAKEGPYRLFVTAYDASGNFASANTPFYVIAP